MPPTDNSENSIYFTTSKLTTGYTIGTTGTWALGNNIGFTDNSFVLWNPNNSANIRVEQNGNATFSNNLTISGTLQGNTGKLQIQELIKLLIIHSHQF